MGKFVQNKYIDLLMKILIYFDPNTEIVIYNINCISKVTKDIKFSGKIKDFTVLCIESGDIKFAEIFDILNIVADTNKLTIFIYEYK